MDPEIKEAVRRFNAAAENFDSFQTRLAELESKGAVIRGSREPRSNLVKLIGENASFKSVVAGESKGCRIPLNLELKTILGSTLFPPACSPTLTYDVISDRDERLHAYPRRALTLLDALPRLPTASNSFEFCRTVHSNTAAEQALEGSRPRSRSTTRRAFWPALARTAQPLWLLPCHDPSRRWLIRGSRVTNPTGHFAVRPRYFGVVALAVWAL